MSRGWLAELRADAARIKTLGELAGACRAVRQALRFEYYALGLRLPTSFVDPEVMVLDDYPDGFRELYRRLDGLQTDPVLLRTYQQAGPVFWDEEFARARRGSPATHYVDALRGLGLRAGISCPVRGAQGDFVLFSLATGLDDSETRAGLRAVAPEAMLAAAWLHDTAARLTCPDAAAGLTARERECLLWCAEGCSAPELAQRLGIAERTVVFHLGNAVTKLGASSRQQAVARAVALGVVEPRATTMPAG